MKASTIIVALYLLLQNVDFVRSTNVFNNADGEGEPGALVCYLFPCFDESLGWKNVFAPIASDPEAEAEATPLEPIPVEDEAPTRQPWQQLSSFLIDYLGSRGDEDAGSNRRHLRAGQAGEEDA